MLIVERRRPLGLMQLDKRVHSQFNQSLNEHPIRSRFLRVSRRSPQSSSRVQSIVMEIIVESDETIL